MRILGLLMKVRAATAYLAFFCLVAGCAIPISAQAADLATALRGKTIEMVGHTKTCYANNHSKCIEATNALRMYSSINGNIFAYFDDKAGVVIPKGRSSAEHVINFLGDKDVIKFRYSNSIIYVTAGVHYRDRSRYILEYKARYNGKSCDLLSHKLTNYNPKRTQKLINQSKTVKCRVRNGK